MKIRILRSCDYDISKTATLSFTAGTEDDRPKAIAEALIARGDAEAIPATDKTAKEG